MNNKKGLATVVIAIIAVIIAVIAVFFVLVIRQPTICVFHFVEEPQNIRLEIDANSVHGKIVNDIELPKNIPSEATAILVNITTYCNADDHVVHSFGRRADHHHYTWYNEVYDKNDYLNDVMITHHGEAGGGHHQYGISHGSHIIPLKNKGTFDAHLCMGWTRGTHYITLQVYGYIL